MVDLKGAWLRFIDADDITLAFLPWNPLVGIAGAFFGDACATGRAATWEIQFPDGRRAQGVSRAGNLFPDETLRVEHRTVEDWMGELSSSIEPAPKGPPAIECEVVFGAPLRITDLPADKQYVRTEIRFSNDADLSPLANLATAVAWGLALERVLSQWRAWHPAARVSWDIHGDDLRFAFSVVGLGVTLQDSVWMGADLVQMTGVIFEAQRSAALAMAPYYVAPKAADRGAA